MRLAGDMPSNAEIHRMTAGFDTELTRTIEGEIQMDPGQVRQWGASNYNPREIGDFNGLVDVSPEDARAAYRGAADRMRGEGQQRAMGGGFTSETEALNAVRRLSTLRMNNQSDPELERKLAATDLNLIQGRT